MTTSLITGLSLALLLPACTAVDGDLEDADTIATALEQEDGGFDMADEAPMFGSSDLFETGDVADAVDYTDPMASDSDIAAMDASADAMVYRTLALWGQVPGDPSAAQPRNWSGTFSVNRGALLVRRTIRFEGVDRILPRDDRKSVSFVSVTLPHNDGLLLELIDPNPAADEELVLTYTDRDDRSFDLPISALVDGPKTRQVDDLGNRVIVGAIPRPADLCNHGRLRGRWHQVAPHRGVFLGGVANALGEPVGHIRGIYGQRANGDKVFFGKYINLNGQFRGIFRGTYGEGQFQGRWVNRNGEMGALGGEYRESAPGDRIGGHFLGRWTELTCDTPLPRP